MTKKSALITGGNKGIGLEVTRYLLENDFCVIVVARDFKGFEFSRNSDVTTIVYNLENTEGIPSLVKSIGSVDVLVNNAGVMYALPFDNYPQQKIDKMLRVNLESPIALIREVSRYMIRNQRGRIVNNASIAGQIGHPDIWYGMTKSALINATKSFSKILGPKGILINSIAPSPVETDMLSVIPKDRRNAFKDTVITNRFAYPKEVAKAIGWLATDSPDYINGTCLDINNGSFPR